MKTNNIQINNNELCITTNEIIHQKINIKNRTKIICYINLVIKRFIDIIGALVGILMLIPITVCIAIAKCFTGDKGPIFYSHIRIGKNGKHFKMYKFRTMCVNADKKLEEVLANNEKMRKEWEENRKIKNDPRITKLGKFIRKNSIDEFPQFINVLLGNMSLVGPRPVVDGEIEKYGEFKSKILSVKPGITGAWAIHGRSETCYDKRVLLEASYVDNFSILQDIKILFKTVILVIKKDGAY